MLSGANCRLAGASDEINLGLDDCRCMVGKLIDVQTKTVIVDYKVLAFYEAIWFHRVEQRNIPRVTAQAQV